jgi:hypothetical protein
MQELATPLDDPLAEALSGSYATVRRFLPALTGQRRLRGDAHRQTPAGGLGVFAAAGSRRPWPPEVVSRAPNGGPDWVDPGGCSPPREK